MLKKRILTGDRPTGKLHLGHYVGSLANRVKLQEEYECFFLIADLHALTTNPQNSFQIKENARELLLDYLSVGIDPPKATIYLQSQIPEVCELATILGMLISTSRLQHLPTLKEVIRDLKLPSASFGLLGYPVLMASDILMVRANLVPVGKDQLSHLEVTQDLAKRFNETYKEIFPIPEALIGEVPTLPGTDGKAKMSKSLGNCIYLSDDKKTVKEKVLGMYTDPTRIHSTDPGHVEGNPVFIYHEAFNKNREETEDLKKRYRLGRVGDIEVKEKLIQALNEFLAPLRARRAQFEKERGLVEKIFQAGNQKARLEAQKTLKLVRQSMGLPQFPA